MKRQINELLSHQVQTQYADGKYTLQCGCGWTITRETQSPGTYVLIHWRDMDFGTIPDTGKCAVCGEEVPRVDLAELKPGIHVCPVCAGRRAVWRRA